MQSTAHLQRTLPIFYKYYYIRIFTSQHAHSIGFYLRPVRLCTCIRTESLFWDCFLFAFNLFYFRIFCSRWNETNWKLEMDTSALIFFFHSTLRFFSVYNFLNSLTFVFYAQCTLHQHTNDRTRTIASNTVHNSKYPFFFSFFFTRIPVFFYE